MHNLVLVLALSTAVAADEPPPLLATKFGELCTVCTATLVCTPTDGSAATAYGFQKKTMLGQMLTVLDYVPGLKSAWEERPVTIAAAGAAPVTVTARLSLPEARILVPTPAGEVDIDRRTGALRRGAEVLGTCAVEGAP
jgi:hypothetical protein